MIKLVIFDWNGTILSDATATLEAENKVLSLFNIKPVTLGQYRELFDIPLTKYYAKVGMNEKSFFENHAKIQKTYHGFYEKRIEQCRARTGTKALLKWLHSNGIKSIILSNHTIESIERHLKRLKLEKYVSAVLANSDVLSTGLKDKAKHAEKYIKENGFEKEQIIIVGDSPEEIKIARQLGVKSIAIAGGWFSVKRLKEKQPDYLIGRLDKAIGIIKRIDAKA
ncbi:MAG: HAD family hydrolase [Candidatus ainarchaeum sp.]|nr:HAD family hydrolase [Candidatus ainarchaeum sp.]